MKKYFSFLKEHWFGLLMSFVILFGFLFFLLILLSPRYDAQKRGFIPCTESLAQNLLSCPQESKYSCGIKYIFINSWCDMKVIGKGFSDWLDGKQKAPWSNYIFEPELNTPIDETDEFYADYKARGISPQLEMQKLIEMHHNLENKNQQIIKEQHQKKEEKKNEQEK